LKIFSIQPFLKIDGAQQQAERQARSKNPDSDKRKIAKLEDASRKMLQPVNIQFSSKRAKRFSSWAKS
jgi:hypothetical protein